jgi:hypothetical protein
MNTLNVGKNNKKVQNIIKKAISQMIESLFFDFKCLENFSVDGEIKMAQTAREFLFFNYS